MSRFPICFLLLVSVLATLVALPVSAAPGPLASDAVKPSAAPLPSVPVEHIGTLYVRTYGTGRQSVILIPGLACGAWVWDQTVRDFQSDDTLYVVTLAGFDGTPPPASQADLLTQHLDSLKQLIAAKKLSKPIVVGHSLGGHLALRLAASEPDAVGGVVIVDSLPLFPPLQPGETLDQRKQNGQTLAVQLINAPDAAYAAQEHQSCAYLVTDPKRADAVADHCLKSDRATVAHAMGQMMSTDLTPQIAQITVPVLLLVPAPSPEASDSLHGFYANAYQGTPHLTIRMITPSRHFIMLDQPTQFEAALRGFLNQPK